MNVQDLRIQSKRLDAVEENVGVTIATSPVGKKFTEWQR